MDRDSAWGQTEAVSAGGAGLADTLYTSHGQRLPTKIRTQQPLQGNHSQGTVPPPPQIKSIIAIIYEEL